MKRRVITFEFSRKPGNPLYGQTHTEGDLSHIWINDRQGTAELINTLFHEFAHSVIHWFGKGIDSWEEEQIARLVGNVVEPCFRKYKHGKTSEFRRTG